MYYVSLMVLIKKYIQQQLVCGMKYNKPIR